MSASRQRLAVTVGEPAGIGPDLCVELSHRINCDDLVFIGNRELLDKRADQLGKSFSGKVHDIPLAAPVIAGQLDTANSQAVLHSLREAAEGCMQGRYAAVVTAPLHKGIINDAGIPFSGHTEYFAGITGGYPVMMLACPGLRVALATTHLPLRDVPDAITRPLLEKVMRILHNDLIEKFAIESPRILVCGLNPHAGEGGHMGREEIEIIAPVLDQLRAEGVHCSEPLPADTLFTPRHLHEADAVLAMYHDQGLPVLKHMGFGKAVNITLGLPIIRTSVDHGTALDLAGSGKADVGSLVAAVNCALDMIN